MTGPERSILPRFSGGPGISLALLAPLAVLGAVGLTWPLARRLGQALPGGGHEDVALNGVIWHAVQGSGLDLAALAQDPSLQLPFGSDLLAREGLPLDALLALPFLRAFGWPEGVGLAALSFLSLAWLSGAWLAGRWTGSLWAAVLAGGAWQASTAVNLHLGQGRLGHTLALALLPLATGLSAEALVRARAGRAVLAGLAAAALVILAPSAAVTWATLLCLVLGGLLGEPGGLLRAWRAGCALLLSFGGALLLPLSWSASSRWLVPGGGGEAVSTDLGLVSAVDVASSGALLAGGSGPWIPGLGLVVVGLSGGLLAARRPRRIALPVVATVLLLSFSLGPVVGPLPGPFRLLQALPGAWWAPVELLAGVELGLVLLAAIGLTRLPLVFRPGVALLLALAFVAQVPFARDAPFPTTPWPRLGGGFLEVAGPVVWIPAPGGPEDPLRLALLDAARHEVSLVNPAVPPALDWSADPVSQAQARRFGPLEGLARLGEEQAPEGLTMESLGLLTEAGAAALVIDHAALLEAGERGLLVQARLLEVVGPPVRGMRYQVIELTPR